MEERESGIFRATAESFVEAFYSAMADSQESAYSFYRACSRVGRPDAEGVISSVTTLERIEEALASLKWKLIEIETVDCQNSVHPNSIFVLVMGIITGEDDVRREFVQSLNVLPESGQLYIHNDVLRFSGRVPGIGPNARNVADGNLALRTPPKRSYVSFLKKDVPSPLEDFPALSPETSSPAASCDESQGRAWLVIKRERRRNSEGGSFS